MRRQEKLSLITSMFQSAMNPKLDWANLHLHFDDVAYCVEWHDRLWPDADRPKIGFSK
jgi:hypothetical protein